MAGFIGFIIVVSILSEFFGMLEDLSSYAPYISALIAAIAGYRYTRRQMARLKAEKERNRREELKEELRQEIRNEMRTDQAAQPQPGPEEEPYYPEVRYFNK